MTQTEAKATYEALRKVQEPCRSVVPQCTVDRYVGGHDAEGGFHGRGALVSSMGFTYTGDFTHGQIEGQGRMTWTDGYAVEGVFRNGVPNGTGAITWPNGDIYVGDLVNGVRHGAGSMTTQQGRASYDGGWSHGARCGWGRQCYPDGAVYEGGWRANQHHGRGMLVYATGDCYDGEWVAGVRQGHGTMGWRRGAGRKYTELYDGEWERGVPCGQGQSIYVVYSSKTAAPDEEEAGKQTNDLKCGNESPSAFAPPVDAVVNMYRGLFANGQREGWGTFFYADGSSYEGEWVGGKKCGAGAFTTAVGATHRGTFANDVPTNMPSLAAMNGSGPAVVPAVDVSDLYGVGDGDPETATAKITSLLLRFNTVLKGLFFSYAAKADDVALAYTPLDWWRHRVPGRISLPQLLRLLSDAGLIGGLVTVSTVLRCVVKAVQAGQEKGHAPASMDSCGGTSSVDGIARADGWLNYAQFTETLIRLAPSVCVGVSCSGGICDKFNALVEERLKAELRGSVPLCPLTRSHGAELGSVLAPLEQLYDHMLRREHGDRVSRGNDFLRVRSLLQFLQPMLGDHGLSLQEAARVMCPFQRSSAGCYLPPGFNVPDRNRPATLPQELYMTGCGREDGETPSLLVSSVIVELELSLVDFVEAIVALALSLAEKVHDTDVRRIIEDGVLALPL